MTTFDRYDNVPDIEIIEEPKKIVKTKTPRKKVSPKKKLKAKVTKTSGKITILKDKRK